MTDNPTSADTSTPTGRPPGPPRWVKVAALVAAVLIALLLVLQLTGLGGEHGPGRHLGAPPAPSSVATVAPAVPPILG